MKKVIFFVMFVSAFYYAAAFRNINEEVISKEVLLPSQINTMTESAAPEKLIKSVSWQNFILQNGQMNVMLDNSNGKVHRAFGQPIKINGFDEINKDNIQAAALKFLIENELALGISVKNLKFIRATEVNGKWYVSFTQMYEGIDVLLSEIELRIYKNGNVMAFGVEYYDDINMPVEAAISPAVASENAAKGLNYNEKTDKILSNDKLFILPVKLPGKVDYHLVYQINIELSDLSGSYNTFVDANSGEIVWRQNMAFNLNTNVTTKGFVKKRFASDTADLVIMPNMNFTTNNNIYTTNNLGKATVDLPSKSQVTSTVYGTWASVSCTGNTNAILRDSITPGVNYDLIWNDNNSHRFERDVYFYADFIHNYFKTLDTSLHCIDFQLPISIQFNGTSPNAGSSADGKSITYLAAGRSEMRLAESSSVLYHEYTHSVTTLLYKQLGRTNGMVNSSTHEGLADVFPAMINDTPEMAPGIYSADPKMIFRTIDNVMIYPDSVAGEGHHDGQILSGAFWDLKKTNGSQLVANLAHYARYGTPDDPDVGTAFGEWLLEVIIADDDDGNLSNGTPHLLDILAAFNKHHIGVNLFIASSVAHTPLTNTEDVKNPYPVNFTINSAVYSLVKLDSIQIVYSADNMATRNIVKAINVKNADYSAAIPAQPNGTSVKYYIEVYDKATSSWVRFMKNTKNDVPWQFLVGTFKRRVFDDFENSTAKWTIGSSEDKIVSGNGKWELAKPNDISFSSSGGTIQMQPGSGYSGNYCYVTGAGGTQQTYFNFMPLGKTSIISQEYNLSDYQNPVLRMYRWFFSLQYNSQAPSWQVYLSNDNGSSWQQIERLTDQTKGWEQAVYYLNDYIAKDSKIKVKITLDNPYINGYYPNFSEGLMDDFEILSTNDGEVNVEENNSSVSLIVNPNPVYENCTISYNVEKESTVSLKILNMLGQEIQELVNGYQSGNQHIVWQKGSSPAGVYIYKLTINNQTYTGKIAVY